MSLFFVLAVLFVFSLAGMAGMLAHGMRASKNGKTAAPDDAAFFVLDWFLLHLSPHEHRRAKDAARKLLDSGAAAALVLLSYAARAARAAGARSAEEISVLQSRLAAPRRQSVNVFFKSIRDHRDKIRENAPE